MEKKPATNARRANSKPMRELSANGFKRVPCIPDLMINETGTVYNLQTGKVLKPSHRQTVRTPNGKNVKVAKLILSAFCAQPIRENSHVKHKNGNKNDFKPENVEYIRKYRKGLKTQINTENLKTAIRCYFEVPKKYHVKDNFTTRIYLQGIIEKRNFYAENKKDAEISVFRHYMNGVTNSRAETAKACGLSLRDCNVIVNRLLNKLISEITADLQAERLAVQNYSPKPKTKKQILREWQEKKNAFCS